jgi:polyisoprenyl-phosphate glycosyltransferase
MPRPEVSLVIPIYNEEEVLPRLDERLQELLAKIGTSTEVVFVDDGSKDRSLEVLREMVQRDPRYRAVSFARNFGHQRAITCGMDSARGKAIVVMDADLQDPPEVILQMIAKWRDGYDVVYGKRRSREGESWFKLLTAKIFYRVFAAMIPIDVPLDAGDFRLMSRRVVVAMRELKETHRFVRGLVSWVGFKQTAVEYDRAARAAGETKYPLRKMISFAFDGIMSFSVLPLRMATYLGVLVGVASVLYGFSAFLSHFVWHNTVPGWTTTVALVSFLFSVQLLMTGVLGEYVGRIYEQVKERPLYIVAERVRHKIRKRQPTRDFGSIGEAIRVTDPPVAAVPPPAALPPPAPKSKPAPPLPSSAKQRDKA